MGITELVNNSPPLLRNILINAYGYRLSRLRFNKNFWIFYTQLIDNLENDPSEIQELYLSNLKNTLIYASGINYYNKLFAKLHFEPEKFNQFEQIQALPILNKEIIRKFYPDFINNVEKKNDIVEHTTSGTTGEKFKFLIPRELLYFKNSAFIYRFYYLLGIRPFDKRITIGGRLFTNKPPYWTFNRFENQLLLSAHHLSQLTVSSYISKIEEFNPIFIQGHPTVILFLAEFILQNNIELKIKMKGIFTTGETLVEYDRVKIEQAFNTAVLQQYGSGESIISAFEGPDKIGYHADIERGYIELIPDGKHKNSFKIIGTSFLNPYMPFIRYDMGDVAEPVRIDALSKDNNLPLVFKNVIGRADDYLIGSNGNVVLPVTIRMVVKPYLPLFSNYQLVQIDKYEFNLNLVDKQKQINISELNNKLKSVIGPKTHITIKYFENIISDGGKTRNVINKNK